MREYLYRLATDKEKGVIAFILKFFLYLLSLIYGLMVRILVFYYRFNSYRLSCKVISIGNITLGGTGKTPFVEMLAKYLFEKGHKVAILSRGYKGKDEAYVLSKNLGESTPILVGKNRIKNAKKAKELYNVDTIILDDGFQHWRLFRDLDIVLVNVKNPFGNNHLIPRGILREPLNSLKRAGIIILTKVDLKEENISLILERIKEINSKAEAFKAKYLPQDLIDISEKQYLLSFIESKRICLLCGIADSESFESTLKNLGVELVLKFIFSDHYMYKEKDVERIINSCMENNVKIIVTTEKDNVRLVSFHKMLKPYLFVLRSKIKILESEDEFFKRMDSLYYS